MMGTNANHMVELLRQNNRVLYRNFYKISVLSARKKGLGIFADECIGADRLICSNIAKPLSKSIDCSDMCLFQYLFSAPKEFSLIRDGLWRNGFS